MFGQVPIFLLLALFVASILMRQGLLFVAALILLLCAMLTWLWERYGLTNVEYRRRFSQRHAFFGEDVDFTVEVVNRKLLPLAWLRIDEEIPRALRPHAGTVTPANQPDRSLLTNLLSLRWYERVRRHHRIRCDARGYHAFGPVRLRSGDIFGFAQREIALPGVDYLLVYPKLVPLTRLGLPAQDPFGDVRTRQWLFADPVRMRGVREYAPGDDPRRVHWKATARTQQVQVKLYESTTTYRLVIFLNMNVSGPYWWWQSYDADLLELTISTAASVAQWADQHGHQVGLNVNGKVWLADQRVVIAPSRAPNQLAEILQVLAKLIPVATQSLELLLRSESRHLPAGATLVIVTAVLSAPIAAELLRLRASGHRVVVLLIGDEAPPTGLAGIQVHPVGGRQAWRDLSGAGEQVS